jgi:Mn-dependent DtxR family transcriptional regulator
MKKEAFLKLVDFLMANCKVDYEITQDAADFLEALRISLDDKEHSQLTDNGKQILKAMRKLDKDMLKAKEIAEEMFVATRSVSGAIRKLVNDGYVEKIGKDPIVYKLTEQGKNINLEEEGE